MDEIKNLNCDCSCPAGSELPKVMLNFSIGQIVQAALVKSAGTVAFGYDRERGYGAVFLAMGGNSAQLVSSRILDLRVAGNKVEFDYFDGLTVQTSSFETVSKEEAQQIAESYKTEFKDSEYITVTPENQLNLNYDALYANLKGDLAADNIKDNTSELSEQDARIKAIEKSYVSDIAVEPGLALFASDVKLTEEFAQTIVIKKSSEEEPIRLVVPTESYFDNLDEYISEIAENALNPVLSSSVNALEESVTELEINVEDISSRLNELTTSLDSTYAKSEELSAFKSEIENSLSEHKEEFEQHKSSASAQISSVSEQVSTNTADIVSIKSQLESISGSIADSSRFDSLSEEIESKAGELSSSFNSSFAEVSEELSELKSALESKQDKGDYVAYVSGLDEMTGSKAILVSSDVNIVAEISEESNVNVISVDKEEDTIVIGSQFADLNLQSESKIQVNGEDYVATEEYVDNKIDALADVYAEKVYTEDISTRLSEEVETLTKMITGGEASLEEYMKKTEAEEAIKKAFDKVLGVPEDSSIDEELDTVYEISEKVKKNEAKIEETSSSLETALSEISKLTSELEKKADVESLEEYLKAAEAENLFVKSSEFDNLVSSKIESALEPYATLPDSVTELNTRVTKAEQNIESKADKSELEAEINKLKARLDELDIDDVAAAVKVQDLDAIYDEMVESGEIQK